MDEQPRKLKRKRRRYGWLITLAVLLALGGWWWCSLTPTVHPVAIMPLYQGGIVLERETSLPYFFDLHGLLLRYTRPGTLSLLNWDSTTRWQVTVPACRIGANDPVNTATNIRGLGTPALSPDGHVFALARTERDGLHVWSWRDGRLLGEVRLPKVRVGAARTYTSEITESTVARLPLQVTDAGRVWVLSQEPTTCRLWAIDGMRVAAGAYTPHAWIKLRDHPTISFSPDGTALLCEESDPDLRTEYATLAVHGAQTVIARVYGVEAYGFIWCGGAYAMSVDGIMVGPHGKTNKGLDSCRPVVNIGWQSSAVLMDTHGKVQVCPPPPAHPWSVSKKAYISSRDGRAALASVQGGLRNAPLQASLDRLPFGDRLHAHNQLVLYTAPGRRRAILNTKSYFPLSIFLYPDNRHLGLLGENKKPGAALLVYAL